MTLKRRISTISTIILLALCILPGSSNLTLAADKNLNLADVATGVDTVWVLLAAFLVFFMQAGFGMAERMKFPAYLIYSFNVSAAIYPLIGHWIWGGE